MDERAQVCRSRGNPALISQLSEPDTPRRALARRGSARQTGGRALLYQLFLDTTPSSALQADAGGELDAVPLPGAGRILEALF